jgi:hypothetical protein
MSCFLAIHSLIHNPLTIPTFDQCEALKVVRWFKAQFGEKI